MTAGSGGSGPAKLTVGDGTMVTITLQAKYIPDRTQCRKVGGTKVYKLRKDLPVYGYDSDGSIPIEIKVGAAALFLVRDSGINIISPNIDLSVDFDTYSGAIAFLEGL
jgi:hypothetical protein